MKNNINTQRQNRFQ